jgi:hypothetical protein
MHKYVNYMVKLISEYFAHIYISGEKGKKVSFLFILRICTAAILNAANCAKIHRQTPSCAICVLSAQSAGGWWGSSP